MSTAISNTTAPDLPALKRVDRRVSILPFRMDREITIRAKPNPTRFYRSLIKRLNAFFIK